MAGPTVATIKRLFAVSGNQCAFPGCESQLVDLASGTVTGEICHIKAKSPNGPRYDPNQTDEERHGFDNLILMCPSHHKIIDDDPTTYTVEKLLQYKTQHESQHAGGLEPPDDVARQFLEQLDKTHKLMLRTTTAPVIVAIVAIAAILAVAYLALISLQTIQPQSPATQTVTFDSELVQDLYDGASLLEDGKIDEAKSKFEKARSLQDQSPDPLYWLAKAATDTGSAIGYVNEALRLDPNHHHSVALKVKLLLLSGDIDEAERMVSTKRHIPSDLDVWFDCLRDADVFSATIVVASELDRKCPPPTYEWEDIGDSSDG